MMNVRYLISCGREALPALPARWQSEVQGADDEFSSYFFVHDLFRALVLFLYPLIYIRPGKSVD